MPASPTICLVKFIFEPFIKVESLTLPQMIISPLHLEALALQQLILTLMLAQAYAASYWAGLGSYLLQSEWAVHKVVPSDGSVGHWNTFFFFWSEGLHSSQWQLLISSQEVLPQVHKEHTFLLNSVELDADLPCYSQTSLSVVSHLCSQATFQHHQIRFQQEKGNQGVLSCMHTDIAVSLISQYVIWGFFCS